MMVVVLYVMKRVIRRLTVHKGEKEEEVVTGVEEDIEAEEDPGQELHHLYVEEVAQEVDLILKVENSK